MRTRWTSGISKALYRVLDKIASEPHTVTLFVCLGIGYQDDPWATHTGWRVLEGSGPLAGSLATPPAWASASRFSEPRLPVCKMRLRSPPREAAVRVKKKWEHEGWGDC